MVGFAEEAVDIVGEQALVGERQRRVAGALKQILVAAKPHEPEVRSPDWRAPRSWPSPRISRSRSASSNPSFVATIASSRSVAVLGELLAGARHEEAVRLICAPPHPAAKLVELGEAEAIGLLHDHDRGVRDVDADLDDRRRDEDVDLSRLEARHDTPAVGRAEAPCRQPTRYPRSSARRSRSASSSAARIARVSEASMSGHTT